MTRDLSVETTDPTAGESHVADGGQTGADDINSLEGNDFAIWLDNRREVLVGRWLSDVAARLDRPDPAVLHLLRQFYDVALMLLAGSFGPYRPQFEPILRQVAELYGSLGAKRSLAAGEIIEEVQILREALIRTLFTDPPRGRGPALLLREILRLNRVVDGMVTFASVGHTDALFFALFRGTGAPEALTPELREEIQDQLAALRAESDRLIGILGRS